MRMALCTKIAVVVFSLQMRLELFQVKEVGITKLVSLSYFAVRVIYKEIFVIIRFSIHEMSTKAIVIKYFLLRKQNGSMLKAYLAG